MQKCESRITVFFDDPFWVAVYERVAGGKLEACKITFAAEPKDYREEEKERQYEQRQKKRRQKHNGH